MVKLDDKQLRQLQLIELEMLLEVDRICRKYQIKYVITGGTLLGAVRHKGLFLGMMMLMLPYCVMNMSDLR